ncbi:PX domain-containing protein kinase-like protein isoform X2 [Amphiura filiformis]|uniref:PX domain-containing protein kinase-like protein isoform X2 n=1 Tax=Amphiura filiformis TaxID=82378 RepID=UPI003B2288C3
MAVFEKRKSMKVDLDDTIPLTCAIEAAQNVQTHIDYVIRVQRGPVPENSWQINRRYSDFDSLNDQLKVCGMDLPLPPKKVFGNMDREFIAERQQALHKYLQLVLIHHLMSGSIYIKRFLDPTRYPAEMQEAALQHVSMLFRSEPFWEVVEPLKDIGWRIRRNYFLVKPKDQPKVKQVLAWSAYGPDKVLNDKDLLAIMKLLPTIQHPFIYPVTFATANETGGFTIRTFHATGTLRDFICKAKPKHHFLKKYCHPKHTTQFNMMNIKTFGRQILEALKFLQEKGIPYGHLHTGNIMLEGNTCRLLDLENSVLGLPSYYREYIIQFKKVITTEAVDVYCFGHVLFEMTFGSPLNAPSKDDFPHTVPAPIKSVLESILNTEPLKTKLPTIDDLLADPLFADVPVGNLSSIQLRVSSKLKDPLKVAKESGVEKRLKEDAKQIASYRRLNKAQAHHYSDEEKKKRKRASAKKRMSQQQTISEQPVSPAASDESGSTANGSVSDVTSPASPMSTSSTPESRSTQSTPSGSSTSTPTGSAQSTPRARRRRRRRATTSTKCSTTTAIQPDSCS